jgi:hypothetical protein
MDDLLLHILVSQQWLAAKNDPDAPADSTLD